MKCIADFNRMSRLVFSGRVKTGRIDNACVQTGREDVLPVMLELRSMLNRMFDRLHG